MTAAQLDDDPSTTDLPEAPRRRRGQPEVTTRWDFLGPLRWMASVEEYVVVRRSASFPFVMLASEYETLSDQATGDARLSKLVQWGVVEENRCRRSTDPRPVLPGVPGSLHRVVPTNNPG